VCSFLEKIYIESIRAKKKVEKKRKIVNEKTRKEEHISNNQ
jgi:hypothetical protein